MKILFRPQTAILHQFLSAMQVAPAADDGRYLLIACETVHDPFGKWVLNIQECVPGDAEALRNTDATATVTFPAPRPSDTGAVVMATFRRGTWNGSMPFHFNPHAELSYDEAKKLGQDIADWLLQNFQL